MEVIHTRYRTSGLWIGVIAMRAVVPADTDRSSSPLYLIFLSFVFDRTVIMVGAPELVLRRANRPGERHNGHGQRMVEPQGETIKITVEI